MVTPVLTVMDRAPSAALYDEIAALGAQAWMTGTEDGLFEAMGNRAQSILVAETDGVSSVSTAT